MLTEITALVLAAGLLPAAVHGQEVRVRCQAGQVPVLSLGITGIECSNCTLLDDDDARNTRWEFRSEPVILGVDPDGPAAGRLRAGDVVVSIDGYLVTTLEGGRRIARPDAGRATEMRVRRDGREIVVAITPTEECRPGPGPGVRAVVRPRLGVAIRDSAVAAARARAIDSVVVSPRVALIFPSPDAAVPMPALLPTGRLGLSFSCSRCGIQIVDDSVRVWSFAEPPTVTAVEPQGPAADAGIRVGDRIVSIAGQSITSDTGGRRFGALRSGEQVTIGIRRANTERTVTLTAGARAGAAVRSRNVVAPLPAPQPETVRYSGRLGDTMISVTGAPVVVTQTETEIIIRSGDITVRLRRDTGRTR